MLNRNLVTSALMSLTPVQRDDILRFQRHKKWSAPLFALYRYIDQSTANRRLKRLVTAGVLGLQRGRPLVKGGREPDVYYLTRIGARVVTRLKDLGSSYVEAPDISNPFDNLHDLAVLEIAVRSDMFQEARAFEQQKVDLTDGSKLVVIPDLYFDPNVFLSSGLYVEVEQTVKPEHVTGKYEKYARLMQAALLKQEPIPWLAVVFPTADTEELLLREHVRAAQAVRERYRGVPLHFYCTSLPVLQRRRVQTFTRKTGGTTPDGRLIVEVEGLLQCLVPILG
jgi:Replication-relaxation